MSREALFVAVVSLALGLTGLTTAGVSPAVALSCFSQAEVRSAVQKGTVVQLSNVLAQIRSVVPGQIVTSPMLCDLNGQLVYMVDVLHQGVVTHVQIDARSGRISQ